MSIAKRRGTLPATIAAALLAARYGLFGGWLVYFLRALRAEGLERPGSDTYFFALAAAWGLLAVLWIWTAICLARREDSRITVATIGLTAVDIVYHSLGALVEGLVTTEPIDLGGVVRVLVEGTLLAAVLVWRPRSPADAVAPPTP